MKLTRDGHPHFLASEWVPAFAWLPKRVLPANYEYGSETTRIGWVWLKPYMRQYQVWDYGGAYYDGSCWVNRAANTRMLNG
jgi:hypothetical protein